MTYIIGGNEVLHKPTPKVGREGDRYQGFSPGSTILQAGHRKDPSLRAFEVDTIFERDIEVPLRDGTILRADVFRPHNDTKLPALISWSPYGKSGSGMLNLSFMPGHAGLPSDALSGYEKFEAPDPAEWEPRGYAIISIDSRGAFDSEGNIRFLGSEEGKDEYDAVEYIAQLPWCTGSVGIVGNSWLAMAPYHIASQQPQRSTSRDPLSWRHSSGSIRFCNCCGLLWPRSD
ncbi:putative xaa-Pro dipeptidyl-peptidase-like domain, cocE/Serine esterase, alpha/Beta hydrolase [Septoria linicola]|nr:putative xaa-Pro dipeptidyl-peptidase-like domain, cocE/Serine esterase, alpha/Beta hydrolase [Septoria linicola]